MDEDELEDYLYNMSAMLYGEEVADKMFDDECFTTYDLSSLEVIAEVDWYGEK